MNDGLHRGSNRGVYKETERESSRLNSVDTLPTLRNVRKRIQGSLKIEKVLSLSEIFSNSK